MKQNKLIVWILSVGTLCLLGINNLSFNKDLSEKHISFVVNNSDLNKIYIWNKSMSKKNYTFYIQKNYKDRYFTFKLISLSENIKIVHNKSRSNYYLLIKSLLEENMKLVLNSKSYYSCIYKGIDNEIFNKINLAENRKIIYKKNIYSLNHYADAILNSSNSKINDS